VRTQPRGAHAELSKHRALLEAVAAEIEEKRKLDQRAFQTIVNRYFYVMSRNKAAGREAL